MNTTGYYHESEIFILSEDSALTSSSDEVGRVFLMDPDEVAYNSTISQLFFYGSFFPTDVSWCCNIVGDDSYHAVSNSFSEIQCPVFVSLSPGVFEV
jgi:hypothetical protein